MPPPGDQVRVAPADLASHAAHLDQLATAITTAWQAGHTTRLDTDAYGHLCVLVPVLLDTLQHILLDGIATAATSLQDTSTPIDHTVQTYNHTDLASQQTINAVRRPQ